VRAARNLRKNSCPKNIAGARKKFRRKNPMICPFCKKTIHIEFYSGRWVAMRDGYEHSCIGLVKALANADASEKSAGGHSVPQREPEQNPSVANPGEVKATRTRKLAKSRRPVQLELQAVD
jgi:hypothetical protein